jgi:hypothetical protein
MTRPIRKQDFFLTSLAIGNYARPRESNRTRRGHSQNLSPAGPSAKFRTGTAGITCTTRQKTNPQKNRTIFFCNFHDFVLRLQRG